MTDQSSAPAPEQSAAPADTIESAPVTGLPNLFEATGDDYSPEQAARDYDTKLATPAESAEKPATAEKELADEANAPPEKDQSGEPSEADPADETLPPIEPPRSWTKEEKEEFKSYPREAQERISKAATRYETEFRRSQNEIAETRKAVEAEREATIKARTEYESKLPNLMQALQDVNAANFSDIRTMADVERMALEDPFRKIQWDTHQQKLQAVAWEKQQAEQRRATEEQTNWQKLVSDENAKFVEAVPEFADKTKAQELTTKAVERLTDLGFTQSELADLAAGKSRLPIYDHRIQQLLVDSLKLAEVQRATVKAVPKAVPAVQKPGVAAPKNAASVANVQSARNKLHDSGSVEDAFALYQAKRRRG